MKKLFCLLVLILAPFAPLLVAQSDPPLATRQLQLLLQNLPQPVNGISASQIGGGTGTASYFYWVVPQYTVGAGPVSGPAFIGGVINTLSGSKKVRVSWSAPSTPAATYDLLRTTTPAQPAGACACAVATGITSTTQDDTSNTLSAYSVNTVNPGVLTLTLQNEGVSSGASDLILRQNGVFVADLSLAGTINLHSPPPIGDVTPNTGAFTTLAATLSLTTGLAGTTGNIAISGATSGTLNLTVNAVAGAGTYLLETVGAGNVIHVEPSYIDPRTFGTFQANGSGSAKITNGDIAAHPAWCADQGGHSPTAGDTWDFTILAQAINAALGCGGSEHSSAAPYLNKQILIPNGYYDLGGNEIVIKHGQGVHLDAAQRFGVTIMQDTANKAAIRTNGFSYSRVSGISFQYQGAGNSSAPLFVLDWDGSTVGWSQALQGNTFQDVSFENASGHTMPQMMTVAASGFMGSENLFLNTHWFGNYLVTDACWKAIPSNAYQNTFMGGNASGCPAAALKSLNGTLFVYSMGMQNGTVDETGALTQTGAEIQISNNTGTDVSIVDGVRSESYLLVSSSQGHKTIVRGVSQNTGFQYWQPNNLFNAGVVVTGSVSGGLQDGRAYAVTVTGTTSGAEPTWSACTPTCVNGTVTFKRVNFGVINGSTLEVSNSNFQFGQAGSITINNASFENNHWSRCDWLGVPMSTSPNVIHLSHNVVNPNAVYLGGAVDGINCFENYQSGTNQVAGFTFTEIGEGSYLGFNGGDNAGTAHPFLNVGRGIGISGNAPVLYVTGGVQTLTTIAKPTCNVNARGTFWAVASGAGVKDTVEVCAKDAADAYAWRTIY